MTISTLKRRNLQSQITSSSTVSLPFIHSNRFAALCYITMAALFRIIYHKWVPLQVVTESYAGTTVIVTGATSGIGLEVAIKFASLGADKVIMTARDLKKGERVKADIERQVGRKNQLELWELDMNSYDSIVAFAQRANGLEHLDIAVLNAGLHNATFKQSKLGFEEDIQVNAISTVLLAVLLLPKLKQSPRPNGKIPVLEFVNSGLHQSLQLRQHAAADPKILDFYNKPDGFTPSHYYSASKLFLMYATNHLAKVTSSGDVIITSVCPGMVATDLARDYKMPGVAIGLWLMRIILQRNPEQGARTLISGTTLGERSHGRFWQHDKIQPIGKSLTGEANKITGLRVWKEIVEILSEKVPTFKEALDRVV